MSGAEPLYCAEPAEAMLVAPLDELTLIYHRRSGATHMVVEPVPQILSAMGSEAVTLAQIIARLSDRFDLGDEGEAKEAVAACVEELVDLGLVSRLEHASA